MPLARPRADTGGTSNEAPPLERACDLLVLSLIAPSALLHALALGLVLLLPLGDASTTRAVMSWTMPVAYLFVATPLSLLAFRGSRLLVGALPEPPSFVLFMRVLSLLFAALTLGATLARFTAPMPVAAGLQDAAGLARLALGLGVAGALWTGKASAPRPLVAATGVAFAAALLLQGAQIWGSLLPSRGMVLVRGAAAALLLASLLSARRARSGAAGLALEKSML